MTSGAHEDASDHTCIVGSKTRGLSFPPPRNPNHLLLLVRNLVTPQSWVRIWKVLIGSADHSGYKSDLAVLGLALKAQLLCCEEVQQSYHGVRSDAGGPESPADVPVGSQDQLRNM